MYEVSAADAPLFYNDGSLQLLWALTHELQKPIHSLRPGTTLTRLHIPLGTDLVAAAAAVAPCHYHLYRLYYHCY